MEKIRLKYTAPEDYVLLEMTRMGVLPDTLKIRHIATLYYPDPEDLLKRGTIISVLNEAAKRGDLKATCVEVGGPHYYTVHRDDFKAFLKANDESLEASDSHIKCWIEPNKALLTKIPSQATPTSRTHELHALIEEVFLSLCAETKRLPNVRQVYFALQKQVDDRDILHEIRDDVIYWRSSHGGERQMEMKTLRNRVGLIRKKYKKQGFKRNIPV